MIGVLRRENAVRAFMSHFPLHFRESYLFLEATGRLWLLDTGAPASFGSSATLSLTDQRFDLGRTYLDLTA